MKQSGNRWCESPLDKVFGKSPFHVVPSILYGYSSGGGDQLWYLHRRSTSCREGPNFATNTWQMEIYNQAFVNLKSRYASAVALMASVVTFASIGVIRKLLEKWG